MRTNEDKFTTVIQKNTFYFYNPDLEERYEVQNLNALNNLLHLFKLKFSKKALKKNFLKNCSCILMG